MEDLLKVYELYSSTGVKDKAGTRAVRPGLDPAHLRDSESSEPCAIIQLLLGNIGIAGGGINALRGEPNVQGSHGRGSSVPPYSRAT